MAVQIIPLSCPKCGNASNVPEKELRFGYIFTCPYCSTTSVLIIDRQLYVPQAGEHVCTTCGRVAPLEARFCQCGQSLVRECTNCLKEFPIDHNLCDYCGWPQDIDPLSEAAVSFMVQRAIPHLSDPDEKVKLNACAELCGIGPAASAAVPALVEVLKSSGFQSIRTACIALGYIGPAASAAVPALVEVLKSGDEGIMGTKLAACQALGKIGPAAFAAVPALVEVLKSGDEDTKGNACIVLSEIGPAAIPALVEVLKSRADKATKQYACAVLSKIGPAAIPALVEVLKSGDEGIEATKQNACIVLGNIGPAASAAVPALVEVLKSGDEGIEGTKLAACQALGKIGPAAFAAVPALKPLARSWFVQIEVKEAAKEAIYRIKG